VTYTLRVFGGFAIEAPPGTPAGHTLQRRAEALLALLAVAGDLGCTRDRLVALLWPESDKGRARHSLRDALHSIRHALGAEAVLGVGETLRLNRTVVATDVQRFTEELAASALEEAVDSYRGPLLDGFHVNDAPEFERWLDAERLRLFGICEEAVERLAVAAEARGSWRWAARWWGRAVELDPFNTRVVVRRMWALASGGDRANAVKEAEEHQRRLVEELDLEPDPAFLAEITRVRDGSLGPPTFMTPPDRLALQWTPPGHRPRT
jgi:DNA-binding SARP family transcriptional activator